MAEIKRGTAMLLTAGDPEISGALAEGIMAARLPMADSLRPATRASSLGEGAYLRPATRASSLGEGAYLRPAARASSLGEGALTAEQVEVVKAEMDRRKVAELLRVAMHPAPVDYAGLVYDAEVQYGESLYAPGVLGKLGEKLLVGYALVVLAFHRLTESIGM